MISCVNELEVAAEDYDYLPELNIGCQPNKGGATDIYFVFYLLLFYAESIE
jgi:hypothetical protein